LSPHDVGLPCANEALQSALHLPKQKRKIYFQMQQGRQTGQDSKSPAMPVAPPLNTAVEFQ
jgi:hypothetical protein